MGGRKGFGGLVELVLVNTAVLLIACILLLTVVLPFLPND
jgi:hypothetical protein